MKKTKTSPKNKKSISSKKTQQYPIVFTGAAILLNFFIFKQIILFAVPKIIPPFLIALIILLLNYTAFRLFEDANKKSYRLITLFYMTLPLWIFVLFYAFVFMFYIGPVPATLY